MDIEHKTLVDYLGAQRRHIVGSLDGLSDADLRRQVLPSGWTCLGLVHHLAYDVERFWFRTVMAGESAPESIPENAWQVGPDVTAEAVFDLYHQESERANAIVAATPLDAAPAWWPDFFGDWRLNDLREIILHVLTETATHAGHLDAARELIDGHQWIVLTE